MRVLDCAAALWASGFACVVYAQARGVPDTVLLIQHFAATPPLDHCDISHGHWMRTPSKQFPYKNASRIDPAFLCPRRAHYMLAWKPAGCALPPFDAGRMAALTQKRSLHLVGDSLVRNMYVALGYSGAGAGVRFHRANYLGAWSRPRTFVKLLKGMSEPMEVVLDPGRANFSFLRDVKTRDIIMFGGGHHFAHGGNVYRYKAGVLDDQGKDVNIKAYRTSLSNALKHLEAAQFQGHVILQTYSPAHREGGDYDTGGTCRPFEEPLTNSKGLGYLGNLHAVNSMLASFVSAGLKLNITLFDITPMSLLRAEAHPGKRRGVSDCSHWCLPGLPDVWNQALLYILSQLAE